MKIHKSYKVPLELNNKQKTIFEKHVGCARFAWNWGIKLIDTQRELKKSNPDLKISYDKFLFSRELNKIKKSEFPWMYECAKDVVQMAVYNLADSYISFFNGRKSGKNIGAPKIKSKRRSRKSFTLIAKFQIREKYIRLPKIGLVKLGNPGYIPLNSKVLRVTCSFQDNKWWASIQVEEEIEVVKSISKDTIGVDLGLKNLAVTSDGEILPNPRFTDRVSRKLRKAQKKLSRKVGSKKGERRSNNFKKQLVRINKIYSKTRNSRSNYIHQFTSNLVKTKPGKIVIEDLCVEGMKHKFGKSVNDAALSEIRRQLEYKCLWNGIDLIIADRFFPSTKMCSNCRFIRKITLSDRSYLCENCHFICNRDENAALNLKNYGTGSHSGSRSEMTKKPVEKGTSGYSSFVPSSICEAGIGHEGSR